MLKGIIKGTLTCGRHSGIVRPRSQSEESGCILEQHGLTEIPSVTTCNVIFNAIFNIVYCYMSSALIIRGNVLYKQLAMIIIIIIKIIDVFS